jgi:hypothetical protein
MKDPNEDIKEVTANDEDFGYEKEPSWTSVDLYYKGFHVKKSMPHNISAESIIASIEDHIKAGFTPSWNADTNKQNGHTETVSAEKQEACQHPEDKLEIKIVQSGKNINKKYARCSLCNAFVRWA